MKPLTVVLVAGAAAGAWLLWSRRRAASVAPTPDLRASDDVVIPTPTLEPAVPDKRRIGVGTNLRDHRRTKR